MLPGPRNTPFLLSTGVAALFVHSLGAVNSDPATGDAPPPPDYREQGELPPEAPLGDGLLTGDGFHFLESFKNEVYRDLYKATRWLDRTLARNVTAEEDYGRNRITLTPSLTYETGHRTKWDHDLRIQADIRLSRLQKKLRLVVDNQEFGRLPASDPSETEPDFRVGLARQIGKLIDTSIGASGVNPPTGYAEARWGTGGRFRDWMGSANLKAYYRTDSRGLGTSGGFGWGRWWDRIQLRSSTGYRADHQTKDEVTWASFYSLGYVERLIEPEDPRPLASTSKVARGYDLGYRIAGNLTAAPTVGAHQILGHYKQPVRKNWIFYTLTPEVRWQETYGWKPDYRIQLSLQILIWGLSR
jgi:hypothetical protein